MNAKGIDKMTTSATTKPHGHYLRYWTGCRCGDCKAAKSDYDKGRRDARRRGETNGIIRAARTKEHLFALEAEGVTVRAIATASGISRIRISSIRTGAQTTVREATERAILKVTGKAAAFNDRLPAALTRDRIAAMRAQGYTLGYINKKLGRKASTTHLAVRDFVNSKTARAVRSLYNQLILEPRERRLKAAKRRSAVWVINFGAGETRVRMGNGR